MVQYKSNMDAGTVEEIFAQIKNRQIAALMFHDQMANYFDFLSLHGYKRLHEYQYFTESAEYRKTCRYYINHHGKLLPDAFTGQIKVIPDTWLTANRMGVGRSTKQKAVEDGFNQYREWESDTKAVYSRYASRLREMGHEADAIMLDRLVEDVDHELKRLDRIILDLMSAGYDMVYIVESQKEIHDKYKKKLREVDLNA